MSGCLFVDVEGLELTPSDAEFLTHPTIAGVTLFARNFESREQLNSLTAALHAVPREVRLWVAVDQEGGRVQRFHDGFTRLPSARDIGTVYARDTQRGIALAHAAGAVMADELCACGVETSFAPVLDVSLVESAVVGERSYGSEPEQVERVAAAVVGGMAHGGMLGVGKHFPGHGGVAADSHNELPHDARAYEDVAAADMHPYRALLDVLGGVMSAHVVFDEIDGEASTFSPYWLTEVLRKRLGFRGVVFSDDLSMNAARTAGSALERVRGALAAGCDIALVCNDRVSAESVVDGLHIGQSAERAQRLRMFHERLASLTRPCSDVGELAQLVRKHSPTT